TAGCKAHVVEPAASDLLDAVAQFLIAVIVGSKQTEICDRLQQIGKLMSRLQRLETFAYVLVAVLDDRAEHSFHGASSQINRVAKALRVQQMPRISQALRGPF